MTGKIISFEGIDGAGKTYWAQKLANDLGEQAIYVSRKNLKLSNCTYIVEIGEHFEKILWKSKPESPVEKIPDDAWLSLHLAWYSIFQENVLMQLIKVYEYIILDGWFYKIFARFLTKPEYNAADLMGHFSSLLGADNIFFLDINPEKCYERKDVFSKCEMGLLDGENDISLKSFINYQNKVRKSYLCIFEMLNSNVRYFNDSVSSEQLIKEMIKIK